MINEGEFFAGKYFELRDRVYRIRSTDSSNDRIIEADNKYQLFGSEGVVKHVKLRTISFRRISG